MASLKIQYRGVTMDYGHPDYRGIGAVRKLNVKVDNSIREYGFTSNLTASIYSPTFRVNGKNCYLARDEYYNTTRESTYATSSHMSSRESKYTSKTYTAYGARCIREEYDGVRMVLTKIYSAEVDHYECGEAYYNYNLEYKTSGGTNHTFDSGTYTSTFLTSTSFAHDLKVKLVNYNNETMTCGQYIDNQYANHINSTAKCMSLYHIYEGVFGNQASKISSIIHAEVYRRMATFTSKVTVSETATRSSQYIVSTSPLTRSYSYVVSTSPLTRSSEYQTYSNNCNM